MAALTALLAIAIAVGFALPTLIQCRIDAGAPHCGPALLHLGATDDWRYFGLAWETARASLMDFGQFPSWNPYHCGGLVQYQDPQTPFPGPIFLLTYFWLPAAAGIKVWIIAHLVAAALGGRALAREMGANAPEQLLCATIVTACGFFAWHIGGGHLSFTPFAFLPWVLWAHRRALRDARWAVLVAALFALAFFEGATYPVPLMLIALAADSLARLGHPGDRRAMYLSLPIFGLFFALLAGARLMPVLRYLGEHPRLVPLDDQMTVAEIFQTWLVRRHERQFPGHVFVWNEFGDYLGLVPVALMLLGVVVTIFRADEQTRARRIDLFVLLALAWCALGNVPGFSLFGLLHELPIYKSLRVPSRFLYPTTVAVAALAVWGLMAVRRAGEERRLRAGLLRAFVVLECLLVPLIAVDMSVAGAPYVQMGMDPVIPRARASTDFYQEAGADYAQIATHPVRGIGTTQCYVPLEWGPAAGLWSGRGPQFRLEPEGSGRVTARRWSPSALDFELDLSRPARLVVNQNYETGWRSSVGTAVSRDGVLAVDLPPGHHVLALAHRPPGLALGVAMSLLGVLLAGLTIWGLTPTRVASLRAWIALRSTGVRDTTSP